MKTSNNRRDVVKKIAAGSAALATLNIPTFGKTRKASLDKLKGNINHSVCRWCYNDIPMEEFCQSISDLGIKAMDLVGPDGWSTLKKYDIYSSMCNGAEISLTEGWNEKQYHEELIKRYTEMIPLVAEAGYKNLICFSGNKRELDDETGIQNCVDGLKQIMSLAEKHNVIVVMELLNSKVNHVDYHCDKTPWGVEVAKRIGSSNFKLLYDIYHMQIDEGDVIRTIRDNHEYIAHYHTGGVPGRNEINESQELYYPAIMKAILETGFDGYVAQEFIPTYDDKIAALKEGVLICDV